ncbi:MAG: hypothetical protein K9J47_00580 [Sulfuritalea sp.]|nr:hypothetical protein [Polynucleobacter sp.]MCF8187242.1 hypothetical protein [Sulfuritalea sp.]
MKWGVGGEVVLRQKPFNIQKIASEPNNKVELNFRKFIHTLVKKGIIMRIVDPYVQLKEQPNSKNVLKLISAMSSTQIEISELDKKDLFQILDQEFELDHSSISEFDEALWNILEKIDISVDWINVIDSYKNKDFAEKKTELKIVKQAENIDIEIRDVVQEYSQPKNSLVPSMFTQLEEFHKNNNFIEQLKTDREQLTAVMWDLYNFTPRKKLTIQSQTSNIDWNLFFELLSFSYTKILQNKNNQEPSLASPDKLTLNKDFKKFEEICIGLSTLLFLSPVACSKNFNGYADEIIRFSQKHLGENEFTSLFNIYGMTKLENIKPEENLSYDSLWLLPNILGIQSGLFGYFLNPKKYYLLLRSYIRDGYETDFSDFPNGSSQDFSSIVSSLIFLISPNFVTEVELAKFLKMWNVDENESISLAAQVLNNKSNLLNINSVSLLLSEPIISSIIEDYSLEDYLSNIFVTLLKESKVIPRKAALWSADNVSDFDAVVYRPVYFKTSRSLIAACCTFYDIDDDPISLAFEGAEVLAAEGFLKPAITFLSYSFLNFISGAEIGETKAVDHRIHQKLSHFLLRYSLKTHTNESYFQIFMYCSTKKEIFGSLFCGVLKSFLNEFKFENVVKLDLIRDGGHSARDIDQVNETTENIPWASLEANDSFQKIFREISHIKYGPLDGVWERKYKIIRDDIRVIVIEIEQVSVSYFKDFFIHFLTELNSINDEKWSVFREQFDVKEKIRFGTITTFFNELQKMKAKSPQSFDLLKKYLDDKDRLKRLQQIADADQLLMSLNTIRNIRNHISHVNSRLRWIHTRTVMDFFTADMNDFIKLF